VRKTKKSVPIFWWDFSPDGKAIIVQGDHPGGEELARFPFRPTTDEQIAKAEKLIQDFESGRKTPKWKKVKP
jgi:hypothetical protein